MRGKVYTMRAVCIACNVRIAGTVHTVCTAPIADTVRTAGNVCTKF